MKIILQDVFKFSEALSEFPRVSAECNQIYENYVTYGHIYFSYSRIGKKKKKKKKTEEKKKVFSNPGQLSQGK
jgi:hypothetical protein